MSLAIDSQRLVRSVVRVNGVPKIGDPELADREWARNTNDRKLPDALKLRDAARRADKSRSRQYEDLSDAVARDKHYRAKLSELEYRKRAGELVEWKPLLAKWTEEITQARNALLGVPNKLKQRHPELALPVLADLDAIIREILESLAPPKRHDKAHK